MGWTFRTLPAQAPVAFVYNAAATDVHADGNNVAWICGVCGKHPVVFVYRPGRDGSGPASQTTCGNCGSQFSLDPPHVAPEPDPPTNPAAVMTIL